MILRILQTLIINFEISKIWGGKSEISELIANNGWQLSGSMNYANNFIFNIANYPRRRKLALMLSHPFHNVA